MKTEDMILISVDDNVVEPPELFDKQKKKLPSNLSLLDLSHHPCTPANLKRTPF